MAVTLEWWPKILRHVPTLAPWLSEKVAVAEIVNFKDEHGSGVRWTNACLVPKRLEEQLEGRFADFDNQPSSTIGPRTASGNEANNRPSIAIANWGGLGDFEPLVWRWDSHHSTILQPDPGFLMHYRLIPRQGPRGQTHWDNLEGPTKDVVVTGPASVYDFPDCTPTSILIDRDHLQDYLTLRDALLVQTIFEHRWGAADDEIDQWLGTNEQREERYRNYCLRIGRGHGTPRLVFAEVHGASVIAGPANLPITDDDLDENGLIWPGIAQPVTNAVAHASMFDMVYVSDRVLGAYEGRAEYRINPEFGSVTHGTQWSVGFCRRVGRDRIQLELKKLYEGNRSAVIRHWHAHATAKPSADEAAIKANIGMRAKALTYSLTRLGEAIDALSAKLVLNAKSSTKLVRHELDYYGWYTFEAIEPIGRHVPLDITLDQFLDRCVTLAKFVVEGLLEASLRKVLLAIGVDEGAIKGHRTLKLLDLLVKLAAVANSAGLSLSADGMVIVQRSIEDAVGEEQPILPLFVLNDLRNIMAHNKDKPKDLAWAALEKVGISPGHTATGYGAALDAIYDQLEFTLSQVAEVIEECT